jgi:hypothetical protein
MKRRSIDCYAFVAITTNPGRQPQNRAACRNDKAVEADASTALSNLLRRC